MSEKTTAVALLREDSVLGKNGRNKGGENCLGLGGRVDRTCKSSMEVAMWKYKSCISKEP